MKTRSKVLTVVLIGILIFVTGASLALTANKLVWMMTQESIFGMSPEFIDNREKLICDIAFSLVWGGVCLVVFSLGAWVVLPSDKLPER